MKQIYIIHENHPKLLLFFAGWAADETPFKQYHPQGMDYMICYDYRTLHFDKSVLDRYRQVNVVAWSMGVWAASAVLSGVSKKKLFCIAFNGSTSPINDTEGIPMKTYQGTLNGLTPASLQKFMRRMCKDSAAYKAFMQITPRRNFNEIKEELKLCHDHYLEMNEKEGNKCMEYDYAFIGENDRIIPPDNQKNNHSYLHPDKMLVTDCAHYDETMFHLLLQDAWDMPSDNFMLHLKTIHIDN